ncbi:hypothetical protein R3P38DRAFT_2651198, partial [Favolaschia claudopus]
MTSSFCSVPAVVAYDAAQLAPSVSLDWVLACGIRTTGSTLTGPLALPSGDGVYTTVLTDVSVVASLPVDLLLGATWSMSLLATNPDTVIRLHDGWFPPARQRDVVIPAPALRPFGPHSEGSAFVSDLPETFMS